MPAIVLKAHFDGQRILLDEDYDLPANTPLLVTVLPMEEDKSLWLAASATGLARAYGDDEPEYTLADLQQ